MYKLTLPLALLSVVEAVSIQNMSAASSENTIPTIEGEVTWAAILAALSYERKEAGFELGATDISIGTVNLNGSITNTIETTGRNGKTTTVKTTTEVDLDAQWALFEQSKIEGVYWEEKIDVDAVATAGTVEAGVASNIVPRAATADEK